MFWLNTASELTLKASFRLVARRLLKAQEEILEDGYVLVRAQGLAARHEKYPVAAGFLTTTMNRIS